MFLYKNSNAICVGLVILSIILLLYLTYVDGFLSAHRPHPEYFLSAHRPHPEYFLTSKRMYVPLLPDFRSKDIM